MTTTVSVKARAWGAKVVKGEETFELEPHEDRTFHLGETESLSVAHGDKPLDAPVEEEESLTKAADAPFAPKAPGFGGKRGGEPAATTAE